MSLDGLMTFAGIVLAILALLDPVQRKSLVVLMKGGFRPYLIGILVFLSFVCVAFAGYYSGTAQGWSRFALDLGSFTTLILASIAAWVLWTKAALRKGDSAGIEELLRLSLLENRFGEVERLLKRNKSHLHTILYKGAIDKLYHPKIVHALLNSDSTLHLELLAEKGFADSMQHNLFRHTETLMRELLIVDESPLRSAVIHKFGGDETRGYDVRERDLIDRTIEDPAWYMKTRADYGITLSAVEKLRSGELDVSYNAPNETYGMQQGKSGRSSCIIYVAIKTHVLALERAVERAWDQDFYVSDLSDIHGAILGRVQPKDWGEFATRVPYAYLIKEIHSDFYALASEVASSRFVRETGRIQAPTRVAGDLAKIWAFCVVRLADSPAEFPDSFRSEMIEGLLTFCLQLRNDPHPIIHGVQEIESEGLNVWLDLFHGGLRDLIRWHPRAQSAIQDALENLDRGKTWFRDIEGFSKELGLD